MSTQEFNPFCAYKPHFDGRLLLTPMDDGRRWVVDETFTYHNGDELSVVVPGGFVTDLASVPRLLWNLFPPFGTYTRAAVVHDVLYCKHTLDRAICDGIFREAMKTCGTGIVTRTVLWVAVRCFGWMFFRSKRSRKDETGSQ